MTAIAFAAPQPRLRITARGRAVLAVLLAAPVAAVALFIGLGSAGAVATPSPGTATVDTATFEYVTVDAGQSLWDLAAEVAPGVDPREFATQVMSLNQLASAAVEPGDRLAIPLQYTD